MSDLDSPRYGRHLSARAVCELSSCPGRAEGVREILEWVLGAAALGGRQEEEEEEEDGFWWEEGEWLRPEGGGDDVMAKVFDPSVAICGSHLLRVFACPT